jgi:hypothetical protein
MTAAVVELVATGSTTVLIPWFVAGHLPDKLGVAHFANEVSL